MNFKQAIEVIRKTDGRGAPVPFSLRFTTWDEKRPAECGKLKDLKGVIPCGAKHHLQSHRQFAVKKADGSGHVYTINWKLLNRINGEPVT